MKKTLSVAALLTMAAFLAVPATATPNTAFERVATHYEAIRQALLHDSTQGVASHAQQLGQVVATLQQDFASGAAGVAGSSAGECEKLLPEIAQAAQKLAAAKDLAAARSAFGELSKPMVRYREMVSGDRPEVVYCPMAKKSWLQPAGEIGNPYLGQKMARCGEVVSH